MPDCLHRTPHEAEAPWAAMARVLAWAQVGPGRLAAVPAPARAADRATVRLELVSVAPWLPPEQLADRVEIFDVIADRLDH